MEPHPFEIAGEAKGFENEAIDKAARQSASVTKELPSSALTQVEMEAELEFLQRTKKLEGPLGERAARIGDHEWVEMPVSPPTWCRFSEAPDCLVVEGATAVRLNKEDRSRLRGLLPPGKPGTVARNKLSSTEFAFAEDIVKFRGGHFEGQVKSNLAGIDGHVDGVPAQLKRVGGRSPTSVTSAAKEAGEKAARAGESGVEVFIHAPNISREAILAGPLRNILTQQPSLAAISVFSADGVVRFVR